MERRGHVGRHVKPREADIIARPPIRGHAGEIVHQAGITAEIDAYASLGIRVHSLFLEGFAAAGNNAVSVVVSRAVNVVGRKCVRIV
jgi:hypothetical protein